MLKNIFKCSLLFIPTLLFAKNMFLVAPTSAEVSLEKPSTASFVVTNNGDDRIRVAISPIYFPVDSKYMPSAKPVDPTTTKTDDITPYMVTSPKVVSIKPGDQRTVRVSIRPPAGLKAGEYRAHVLFAMLDIAETIKTKPDKEGLSMKINFKSETAVVVYGSVGTGTAQLNAKCEVLKTGKKTKVTVTNSGDWRFDGWLRIYDGDKKRAEDKMFIVRNSVRSTVLNWAPPADSKDPIKIRWVPLDEKKKEFTTVCSTK